MLFRSGSLAGSSLECLAEGCVEGWLKENVQGSESILAGASWDAGVRHVNERRRRLQPTISPPADPNSAVVGHLTLLSDVLIQKTREVEPGEVCGSGPT